MIQNVVYIIWSAIYSKQAIKQQQDLQSKELSKNKFKKYFSYTKTFVLNLSLVDTVNVTILLPEIWSFEDLIRI